MPQKALFLDRDGTLIKDQHYLADINKIEWLDGVLPTLQRLHQHDILLVIITNQSGIGRGLIPLATYLDIQNKIEDTLRDNDSPVAHTFYCPHHPKDAQGDYRQDCSCRKPEPGMLIDAMERYHLEPQNVWMMGDSQRDVQAGQIAGCNTILFDPHGQNTPIQGNTHHVISQFSDCISIILNKNNM